MLHCSNQMVMLMEMAHAGGLAAADELKGTHDQLSDRAAVTTRTERTFLVTVGAVAVLEIALGLWVVAF
jgi:hypothetical protein